MGRIKKILCFVFLLCATSCLFVSCSCSFGKNKKGGGGGGGETPPAETITYTVTVSMNNTNGGFYTSSTGSDVHVSGTSPVYTITPSSTWAIKSIKVDGVDYYTYDMNGYLFESKDVTIINISANTVISVEFAQIWFDISFTALDSGFSDASGGTIVEVNSLADGRYLGGESAEFVITPYSGYIIHSVYLNDEEFYFYSVGDRLAEEEMRVELNPVAKDINIKVEFYKKEDLNGLMVNTHYGTNAFGETVSTVRADSLVSYSAVGYAGLNNIPNGASGAIEIVLDDYVILTGIDVSFDNGVSFVDYIDANIDYEGNGFSYLASEKTITFDNLSNDIRLNVYTEAETKNLILYDFVTKQSSEPINAKVYSYLVIQDWMAGYDWFYSLDSAYQETNTHRQINVISNEQNGNTIYSIYLSPEIVGALDRIVLIYKSN